MACTWFGEVPSCCSLSLLLGPVWLLLKYVLQTIFSGPVHRCSPYAVHTWILLGIWRVLGRGTVQYILVWQGAALQTNERKSRSKCPWLLRTAMSFPFTYWQSIFRCSGDPWQNKVKETATLVHTQQRNKWRCVDVTQAVGASHAEQCVTT